MFFAPFLFFFFIIIMQRWIVSSFLAIVHDFFSSRKIILDRTFKQSLGFLFIDSRLFLFCASLFFFLECNISPNELLDPLTVSSIQCSRGNCENGKKIFLFEFLLHEFQRFGTIFGDKIKISGPVSKVDEKNDERFFFFDHCYEITI